MPVHVGIPAGDVQVLVPAGGVRQITWQRGVDPRLWVGKGIAIRAGR